MSAVTRAQPRFRRRLKGLRAPAEVLHLRPAAMLIRSMIALLIVGGQSAIGFVPYQQRGRWATSRRKQCCRKGLAVMMGAKRVHFGDKGLDKLVEGINVVGEAVRVSWEGSDQWSVRLATREMLIPCNRSRLAPKVEMWYYMGTRRQVCRL